MAPLDGVEQADTLTLRLTVSDLTAKTKRLSTGTYCFVSSLISSRAAHPPVMAFLLPYALVTFCVLNFTVFERVRHSPARARPPSMSWVPHKLWTS